MLAAVGFLTIFGDGRPPGPNVRRWFPLVGAAIGIIVGGAWWLSAKVLPPIAAASVVVGVGAAITGGLHYDGLADSADGLLAPMDRQRRLEVLRDPHVGVFGVLVVVLAVIAQTAALTRAPIALALAALYCTTRLGMVVAMAVLPSARPSGLSAAFGGDRIDVAVAGASAAVLIGAAAIGSGHPVRVLVAVAGAAVAMVPVLALAQRRLGGFTGDVIGASAVCGETIGLLVLAGH